MAKEDVTETAYVFPYIENFSNLASRPGTNTPQEDL
jgi:hypothetical protein